MKKIKKEQKGFVFNYNYFYLILIFILLLLGIIFVKTFTGKVIDPTNPEDPLGIGVNPDNLPQTPEDAANVSATYLKQEWGKILTENKVVGPVHRAFLNTPTPFVILFGEAYDATFGFLLIVFFWFYFAFVVVDLLYFFGKKFSAYYFLGGALVSVALAQLGFFRALVNLLDSLLNKQENWMVRIFVVFCIIFVFVLIKFFFQSFKNYALARFKIDKEATLDQNVEESKAYIDGLKEGRKLTKDLREMKRKAITDISDL